MYTTRAYSIYYTIPYEGSRKLHIAVTLVEDYLLLVPPN
jgi:hypothetical protein